MSEYVPTIGLEIHAELRTKTKMFCRSKNDADEARPNVNICPVCLAHPGVLPVINKEAVKHVLKVGAALGGKLADYTEFDRKNYFYPDLPKGYQLSQYEYPLVSGGELVGVAVTRVHLEEDTASSMHLPAQAGDEEGTTLVDYNRAGVPLMELVTEPVITTPEQAGIFARELQLLLRALGASEANMEKGEMRVEANVSVSKKLEDKEQALGTKVEIKNLNSFRAMERAVRYEIKRQTEVLRRGEKVAQETRGWDEAKQATFAQRTKEGSADYRYFPDPDLPSLRISEVPEFSPEVLKREMPELPSERRERYARLGIKGEDSALFTAEGALGAFFDAVVAELPSGVTPTLAANYVANDLVNIIRDIQKRDSGYYSEMPISARDFNKIMEMVGGKRISSRAAKDILLECAKTSVPPEEIAEEKGLFQKSSGADLSVLVGDILAQNAGVVEEYRRGKTTSLEYLVGQGMRAAKGSANPTVLRELILSKIAPDA